MQEGPFITLPIVLDTKSVQQASGQMSLAMRQVKMNRVRIMDETVNIPVAYYEQVVKGWQILR